MGYQLKRVGLCNFSLEVAGVDGTVELVTPYTQFMVGAVFVESVRSCGGALAHAVHLVAAPLPVVAVHTGAVAPVLSSGVVSANVAQAAAVPVQIWGGVVGTAVRRSAGSCSSRIAFGLIGLVPGAVGGIGPRANPSCSHSMVTGTKAAPPPGLYSTRSQPSIRFQVEL